jgi:aminoglycoside 6'-N-acetyltransferase
VDETRIPRPSPSVTLRNATLADLDRIEAWDKKEHMQASIGDYEFNDWNWKQELPRNPSWRFQLIAEVGDGVPIGFVQIIDALEEETHYWGLDCEPNLRAIDIWIGEEDYLGKGHGTQMMETALRDYCFSEATVEAATIDLMADNTDAHRFYQRLGFQPTGIRYFGPDQCLVHRLNRSDFERRR